MGGGKGGGSTTTNTVAEPWEKAQPFLENLLGDAQAQYESGNLQVDPWQGIRVAPQSAMTQGAQNMFWNTASQGNPITPQAQAAFGDIASGNTIYNDLDGVKQSVLGDVLPAVSSRFGQAGMLDSTLAADAMGRAATQAIAPIEYGAFDQAQNRRLGALGMAPQLAGQSYLDAQMLGMAGGQQDQYHQRLLDSAIGQHYETLGVPYDTLQRGASLGMGFGGIGGSQESKQGGGGGGAMETIGGIMSIVGPIAAMAMM